MQQRFLLQILLLAQHVSGTTMPIIRSSRVLYSGWPVVFGAVFFKFLVWCGAKGYVSGFQDVAANRTHNPQLHTRPVTCKPQHEIPQAATIV